MKKENDLYTILSILFVILAVGVMSYFYSKPYSTAYTFSDKEPINYKECNELKGICVPVYQGCITNTVEYGVCSGVDICCVQNLCELTGGEWAYKYDTLNYDFYKYCQCKLPYQSYEILRGCVP